MEARFLLHRAESRNSIQLFAIDAKHKRIVCTKELWPSGDVEADMKIIMEYYRPFEGCAFYPEKFAIENSL